MTRLIAAGIILAALFAAPAPLLPPHALAEAGQRAFGLGWAASYLAAALVLHVSFYGVLGVLAAFTVGRAATLRGKVAEALAVSCLLVATVIAVRILRLGHVPVWENAIVPVSACIAGVALGMGVRHRGWIPTLAGAALVAVITPIMWIAPASSETTRAVEQHLRRLVAAPLPATDGDTRFGALLRTAFAPIEGQAGPQNPVEHNRTAILALGVALGHERLAKLIGLSADPALLRDAAELRERTTLRGRDDWARHYALSAALAVLENPFVSDAAGLMKEQLDALTRGSGFSFADLAADRAGVRFAAAATRSDDAARGMQERLARGFDAKDFFPKVDDLPENLSVEEFRRRFGGVGAAAYRATIAEIDARLDRCAALD